MRRGLQRGGQSGKSRRCELPRCRQFHRLLTSTDTDMLLCRSNSSSPEKVQRLKAKPDPKLSLNCRSSLLRQILTDASLD